SDGGETAGQTHRPSNKQLANAEPALQQDSTRTLTLNGAEWTKTVQKLSTTFSDRAHAQPANNNTAQAGKAVPTGKVTPLQEDRSRYYALAVLEKSDNWIKLATVTWLKEPSESWLARVEPQLRVTRTI